MTDHDPMIEIMRRRERLLARCDAQRAELTTLAQRWEGPLKVADRVVAVINYLRGHPLVLGAAVTLLVVVQRRDLWSWVRRGFMLWRAYRTLGKSRFTLGV